MICDDCETVKHCTKHGCVPKQDNSNYRYDPPVAEPVAWRYDLKQTGSFAGTSTEYSRIKLKIGENWTPLYTTPPAAPVQSCYCLNCEAMGKELAALKAQPAPVPLDAGEISRLWKRHTNPDGQHHNPYDDDGLGFAKAVLAAAQPAVPLTDEQILNLAENCTAQYHDLLSFGRAVLAAAQPAPVQDEDLYNLAVKADNGGQP